MPRLAPHAESPLHPVERGHYAIFTPPIHEFFATVCDWIDSHVTGGYVYGPPRQGKSRAVQFWIERLLTERYGSRLPFFRMNYRVHDRFSELELLTELLQAAGHRYLRSGNRTMKLGRLVRLYSTRARNAGSHHVVLMIDEAQNMREQSYRTLCNVQNELDELGFELTVVSVGTQDLVYQHSAFVQGGDLHLVGRFMMREAFFRGIASEAELAYVLEAYDQRTEWPEGSGVSYTRYFFPQAFDAGLRLADCAGALWGIYTELAPPKLRCDLAVAMEHVAKAVESLFRTHGGGTSASIALSHTTLLRAVENTRFRAYMQALAQMPAKARHAG